MPGNFRKRTRQTRTDPVQAVWYKSTMSYEVSSKNLVIFGHVADLEPKNEQKKTPGRKNQGREPTGKAYQEPSKDPTEATEAPFWGIPRTLNHLLA